MYEEYLKYMESKKCGDLAKGNVKSESEEMCRKLEDIIVTEKSILFCF